MSRKFLSFLGTGDYKPCIYELKGKRCNTAFAQEALIEFICKDWANDDIVYIFITQEAMKKNWNNPTDEAKRLEQILRRFDNIQVIPVSIPSGKDISEIWKIFEIVLSKLEDEDEVVIDITHSFRSLPMLVFTVLNYAKVLKNIKLDGVYYGAYEARNENNIAPIFDLTVFDQLLDWAQGVNAFLKYGNSQHIHDISKNLLINRLQNKDRDALKANNFVTSLNDFTNCILTCRGRKMKSLEGQKDKYKKSIAYAYERIVNNIYDIKNSDDVVLKPLDTLFDKIEEKIENFDKDDNLKNGLAIIEWCIQHNLIQQAYTAFEETIITYLCIKYKYNETDAKDREIISCALNIKTQNISEINGKFLKDVLKMSLKL